MTTLAHDLPYWFDDQRNAFTIIYWRLASPVIDRLLYCGLARRNWSHVTDWRCQKAVEVGERYALGARTANIAHWHGAAMQAGRVRWPSVEAPRVPRLSELAQYACQECVARQPRLPDLFGSWPIVREVGYDLLGDVRWPVIVFPGEVGPLYPDPGYQGWTEHRSYLARWSTPQVVSLARACYQKRLADGLLDPVRQAILADALEEVGCNTVGLLEHLRGKDVCRDCWGKGGTCKLCQGTGRLPRWGPCVLGCWALRVVLAHSPLL